MVYLVRANLLYTWPSPSWKPFHFVFAYFNINLEIHWYTVIASVCIVTIMVFAICVLFVNIMLSAIFLYCSPACVHVVLETCRWRQWQA